MKSLRSFTVRPALPTELAALEALAQNLRWSWDEQTRDLFRWVDPEQWDASIHDPVRLLGLVSAERLEELAADAGFLRFLDEVNTELQGYLSKPRWFQAREGESPLRLVAYFSPEFGIAEALPQYSGGLGVLAGDHLKASSDLGVPLVGVGLFYKHGYFRQALDIEGWQQERYPDLDPYGMALTLCEGVTVTVDMAGTPLHARVWRADVGRVPLYLLDADIEANAPELREITNTLYGGDTEHRLRQEILLGVGGVRALEALGIDAQVFHTNEGHAGFLGFERIRRARGRRRPQLHRGGRGRARRHRLHHPHAGAGRHRPVPPRAASSATSGSWAKEVGITADELMAIGQPRRRSARGAVQHGGDGPPARRPRQRGGPAPRRREPRDVRRPVAGRSHRRGADPGDHQRRARAHVGVLRDGGRARAARAARVGRGRHRPLGRILDARDDELWRARAVGRERMVAFVRRRLRESFRSRGFSPSDLAWCDEVLDPSALTVCFARRFATYKRATLLLSQSDRLKSLLLDTDRPLQFVFAGKAHPADDSGKAMIQGIVRFAADLGVRHRFVFLEDYDIAVARALYQGADVWLNNPRRPQEACGTSGMKAALNGALNCSILDGWWDECFDGEQRLGHHVRRGARR